MLLPYYLAVKNWLEELRREEGQGLAEYALILVLIAIVVIVAVAALGTRITGVFEEIVDALTP